MTRFVNTVSCVFVFMAGLCFVSGVAILKNEG